VASQTLIFAAAQLELGSAATTFERRTIGDELASCQRYYYRVSAEAANAILVTGNGVSTTSVEFYMNLPVSLRALPTSGSTTDYSTLNSQCNFNVSNAVSAVSVDANSTRNMVGLSITSTGQVANATARLIGTTSGTSYLGISAEL
jgi:hypothetical protein